MSEGRSEWAVDPVDPNEVVGRRRRKMRRLAIVGGGAALVVLALLAGSRTPGADVATDIRLEDGRPSASSRPGDGGVPGRDSASTTSATAPSAPSAPSSPTTASPPSSEPTPLADEPPPPSASVPAPTLEPGIVVVPSTGLERGDLVTITATGYGPGRFFIVGGSGVNAVSPFGSADRPRSETAEGPFSFTAYVTPWAPEGTGCAHGGCTLDVTVLQWCDCRYGPKEVDRVSVPVAFAPVGAPPPPPSFTLVADGPVTLGETRTVVLDGLLAGEPVRLSEWRCETPSITSPYLPWPATVTELTADAAGRLQTTVTIDACPAGSPPDRPSNRFRFESLLGPGWAHDIAAS